MTQITLNDEQTRLLASGSSPIVIIDARGRKVAEVVAPHKSPQEMTDDEWIAEAIRRKKEYERNGGRLYTTAEVQAHLRTLLPE